jgi:hypothetical protein
LTRTSSAPGRRCPSTPTSSWACATSWSMPLLPLPDAHLVAPRAGRGRRARRPLLPRAPRVTSATRERDGTATFCGDAICMTRAAANREGFPLPSRHPYCATARVNWPRRISIGRAPDGSQLDAGGVARDGSPHGSVLACLAGDAWL